MLHVPHGSGLGKMGFSLSALALHLVKLNLAMQQQLGHPGYTWLLHGLQMEQVHGPGPSSLGLPVGEEH